MGEPYLGEIRMIGFEKPPPGWERCDGQMMQVSQNPSLSVVLGTHYGGDGRTYFGLPDMNCRMPIHRGPRYPLGTAGGSEEVTLTLDQMPVHSHTAMASTGSATEGKPSNSLYLAAAGANVYKPPEKDTLKPMNAGVISTTWGDGSHNNMMPSLGVVFIIAVEGKVPPRSGRLEKTCEPFTGEIRIFAGSYAPVNWHLCDGNDLPAKDYPDLYKVISTTFGGIAPSIFTMPWLACRVPVHSSLLQSKDIRLGSVIGDESVEADVPKHTHAFMASSAAASAVSPVGNVPAVSTEDVYAAGNPDTELHQDSVALSGEGLRHENMSPFLCLNYIICTVGQKPHEEDSDV